MLPLSSTMTMKVNNDNRRGISNIPHICKELGIAHVVLCPGSRNAPLILAFTRHKEFNLYSIVDERSAGYFALGISLACQQPVALVCTSGTAVLNLAPAIAEAYYQNIPLIVFTADRPVELIDQGDGQTIHQRDVFGRHVKFSTELPVDTSLEADLWLSDRLVAQAIINATEYPKAPVHINVPLREPLYTPLPPVSNPKIIRTSRHINTLEQNEFETLIQIWNLSHQKMIVAGGIPYKNTALNDLLIQLAQRSDTLIIAENLSNLYHPKFIYDPEKFLAALPTAEKTKLQPDLLISIGNSIVSKRLKLFLREYRPTEHWLIDENCSFVDTYMSLTRNIPSRPETIFQSLISNSVDRSDSTYANYFVDLHQTIQDRMRQFIDTLPFCDLTAVHYILNELEADTHLHLANSMPVRYAQLFATRPDIRYFSNRGTSGIDGCTSTCVGMTTVIDKPTVLITGDLAFLYDSNALWNKYLKPNLKIIVLNNGGGNIFQMIDTSPEIEPVLQYFTTPQSVQIKPLTEAYGLQYVYVDNFKQLSTIFESFLHLSAPAVMEIKTDPNINVQAYKQLLKNIQL